MPSFESKVCPHCDVEQPLDQFRVRSDRPHMRESWCRTCNNRRSRENWRGLKLRTGTSNSTQQKHLRPYQFVCTDLQRAYSSLNRGAGSAMLKHLSAATNALERLTVATSATTRRTAYAHV